MTIFNISFSVGDGRDIYDNELNWKNSISIADGKMTIGSKLFKPPDGERTPSATSTFPKAFRKQSESAYDNASYVSAYDPGDNDDEIELYWPLVKSRPGWDYEVLLVILKPAIHHLLT